MAQSLEKRMTDIEYINAHLPDDLNARFAGIDVKNCDHPRDAASAHAEVLDARTQDRRAGNPDGWAGRPDGAAGEPV